MWLRALAIVVGGLALVYAARVGLFALVSYWPSDEEMAARRPPIGRKVSEP